MNFESLLAPIDGDNPSGTEVRHDLGFHDLERLTDPAQRALRTNEDGSLGQAEPNVEWSTIIEDGAALAAKGRDLRLLVLMTRAHYNVEGFAGLADAVGFLADTMTQYWDTLHPALRDRDDPKVAALPRLNALRQLSNDDDGLLCDLRFGVILNPRGIGPITGDDLVAASLSDFDMLGRAASGLGQAEKDALVAAHAQRKNRVQAAVRAMAAEHEADATALIEGIAATEAAFATLSDAIAAAGGFAEGPGLPMPEVEEFLALCRKTLEAGAAATAQGDAPIEDNPAAVVASGASAPTAQATGGGGGGAISSRRDVEAALDRIIGFYERTEPGSPLPHLARRMRRMVTMDFLELIEEIAPSGLKEFRNVAGVEDAKKK